MDSTIERNPPTDKRLELMKQSRELSKLLKQFDDLLQVITRKHRQFAAASMDEICRLDCELQGPKSQGEIHFEK
jgi:hypothetical protein